MDILKSISNELNTFSDEAQKAVFNKCSELGFDPNKGDIKLTEAFINLQECRDILEDAIKRNKMSQMPLSIQKAIYADVAAVSMTIASLLSGKDEVINLVNNIEGLFADIWKFGFHNLTEEFLGYQTKINQLKYQATKAKELQKDLEKGLELKKELEITLAAARHSSDELKNLVNAGKTNSEAINQHLTRSLETAQKSSAQLVSIEQSNSTATQLLANSKTSNAEVQAMEQKIKEFFAAIDNYKKEISDTSTSAKNVITKNDTDTKKLVKDLADLESQIKVQIERATGHSLFHSFQTRQGKLVESKTKWVIALAAMVATSVGITYWIAVSTTVFDIGFYLKLSMSIPLVYAITFCTVQYTKERKLEEEYAFKANISISLLPYKELVEKLIDKSNTEERQKFTNFIIDSIEKVFSSPTSKVFDINVDKGEIDPEKAMKKLSNTINVMIKPFESIIKLVK